MGVSWRGGGGCTSGWAGQMCAGAGWRWELSGGSAGVWAPPQWWVLEGGEDLVSIWEHWQQQEILLIFSDDISISSFFSYLNNI